ncbi:MAG TPA: hypothetical protein VKZ59_11505 [Acidobacteriota bacterium]|nr:hypothetical protein [Acidobacteriota bacterium]
MKVSQLRLHLKWKFLAAVLVSCSLVTITSAQAQRHYYIPYIAPAPWTTTLVLTSGSSQEQGVHIRYFTPLEPSGIERAYEIPPGATERVDLGQEVPNATSAVLESDDHPALGIRVEYSYESTTTVSISPVASQRMGIDVPDQNQVRWTGLAITNFGDTDVDATVSAYNEAGELLASEIVSMNLHGTEAKLLSDLFPGLEGISSFLIEGDNRLGAILLAQDQSDKLLSSTAFAAEPTTLDVDPNRAYFLIGYPEYGNRTSETFILALSDPDHIAEAREVLANPLEGPIVTGTIARGDGGYNRNMTELGSPVYSWHVDEFTGFVDVAAEVCDGGPLFVEFDLEYWLESVGHICFWRPTVVRELTAEQVATGILAN